MEAYMCATVVYPRPNPWDEFPSAMEKLSKGIHNLTEPGREKADLELLGSLPPEQLAANLDKFKSSKFREAAVNSIIKQRMDQQEVPVYGYDSETKQYGQLKDAQGKPLTQRKDAVVSKPDPTDAILARGMIQEQQGERRHQQRMDEIQAQGNQAMERALAVAGYRADQHKPSEAELAYLAAQGDPKAIKAMDYWKQWKADSAGGKAKAVQENKRQDFDPQTVDYMARTYIKTGTMPPLGMGGTEARKAIYQRAAQISRTAGTTPEEIADRQSARKSLTSALSELEKRKANILAFSNTTEKNLAVVDELSQKVDRTGVPIINRWLLAGKRSLAGDPDVAKFDAATRTAINEFAKVTSSATGGGVTSDQARKEVEELLNTAQTPEQIKGVIDFLRREMGNRRAGFDDEEKTIREAMKSGDIKLEGSSLDRFWK